MVDGIHANRKKWEELCLSYEQARQVSESSNPCPEVEKEEESGQCTDSTLMPAHKLAAANQNTDSTHRAEST